MVKVYTTNSFAEKTGGGNPAAVVFAADALSEEEMQKIAREIGFSETAFVMHSCRGDFKVRYFTPVREVDLCGHATIAVFSLLRDLNIIAPGQYRLETIQEELHIEISHDSVMMELSRPVFSESPDLKEVTDSLNIEERDLLPEYLPQFVSTGLKDLIVPVRTKEVLDQIRPDFDKITHLSRRYDAAGYHLFALDQENVTAYTRNFAPALGIREESATGTASGALAAYLHRYGLIPDDEAASLIFLQGEAMGRPSIIRASIEERQGEIRRIFVGGSIRDTKKIQLEIE